MTKAPFYPDVPASPELPKLEEAVLAAWKKENIFGKSIENRSKNNEFIFYDGPPFANGLPHYGHLLTSFAKDIVARYQTMKGKRTERRFGWDCHGLPAEMESEKELGISGRAAIEGFGIDKFNNHCRQSVMKYTGIWQDVITRAARWVDFQHDYKTMDKNYMESVIWAFSELYKKGLVYESHRVMPYSWAAETPLSNFETRMDGAYRDREDKAITVAFKLKDKPKNAPFGLSEYWVLAWTTTPWTLPSNLALGVSSKLDYVCIEIADKYNEDSDGIGVVLAKSALKNYAKELGIEEDEVKQLLEGAEAVSGKELLGLAYEPLFPYFRNTPNAFKVLDGTDFIEEGSGTGVVHLAPGFGEDDQRVCEKAGIPLICPVDEKGRFTGEITDLPNLSLKGLNVIADTRKSDKEPYKDEQLKKYGLANLRIITWLKDRHRLIRQDDFKHSYPHCWRTDTPLIYRALPSWYVEVTKFKDRMVRLNQNIHWIPEHIRDGQFGNWLEGARDWSISRNRFWGCPIPVWRTEKGKIKVFGSISELEDFFGKKVEDLHRPFIDTLTKTDSDGTWTRVSDVFDCWFESGSMPFAQVHYPFENKEWFHAHFPADFIVEYVGQTRGWFYTLMVLATALFDKEPFKNCICHGIILDAEGKKLSKRLRNYPDPNDMFNTYGADAMRLRMVKEPVMHGGNLLISKDGSDIRDVVRLSLQPIWNAYRFFTMYANADGIEAKFDTKSTQLLDRYILAKCRDSVERIDRALLTYLLPEACSAVDGFFEVLNNWYIRRSRDRFWSEEKTEDKQAAYNTLYTVLVTVLKAAAPLLPLLTDSIYTRLTGEASIHLTDFPDVHKFPEEKELVADMDRVRDICNAALALRNEQNIRVRQPLGSLTVVTLDTNVTHRWQKQYGKAIADIINEEVNVKYTNEGDKGLEGYATFKLQINFPILGKRLPEKMKQIIPASKQGQWKQLADGTIEICGEKLLPEEAKLSLEPKPEFAKNAKALSTNDALVVLDLKLTPELENEGLARDVVRLIQESRKNAKLNISDRIQLTVETSPKLKKALEDNKAYVEEQTLCALSFGQSNGKPHSAQGEIEGEKIALGFAVTTAKAAANA
jgi:isoleucyl-tRNA synthetase